MKKTIKTYIVDSFTNEPFKGNPAGVCILDQKIDEIQMQSIAKELGLSETAFIKKTDYSSHRYAIRFFSPKMEIPLCGHATLASAKVIFDKNPDLKSIEFKNIHNLHLPVQRNGSLIQMTFPIYGTEPQTAPNALLEAIGIDKINNSEYNAETKILLVEMNDSDTLCGLSPNFEKLKASHDAIHGVLVTAPSKKEDFDFESRYFWPWSGTNEDPVTGGTHTFLANYWSSRLHKTKMRSFQCSERTGFMTVELLDDHHMTIESEAQIVFEGILKI